MIELARKGVKLDGFQEDVSHLQDMRKRLKAEYEAQKVALQTRSPVQVLEAATVVRTDDEPGKRRMAGGAALGGLLFALFGVCWVEFRPRRVGKGGEGVAARA